MKSSTKMTRQYGESRIIDASLAGGFEIGDDHLVVHLPDPRLLFIVARSLLVAAMLVFIILLRASLFPKWGDPLASAAGQHVALKWVDNPFHLPLLLRDLRREGLLVSAGGGGDRAVFLGDGSSRLPLLKKNKIEVVSPKWERILIRDDSVDFMLTTDIASNEALEFADRALKVGGVALLRLSTDPKRVFSLPENYRIVYIRRFGCPILGIKKIAHGVASHAIDADDMSNAGVATARRALSVQETQKQVVGEQEDDVLLEPSRTSKKKARFLRSVVVDRSLQYYPRRVFVDVGESRQALSEEWFRKYYPRRDAEFEIVRLNVIDGRTDGAEEVVAVAAAADEDEGSTAGNGISEWLQRNVGESDYVVMKAEAAVVEEMMRGDSVVLVDELFLECKNQWQKGKRTTRAYWECLALYGKLKDQGVAVHQWWA